MNNVAVILSTFNGERYIKEQLNSILEQTYQNIDIFIRDDGSNDATLEIINQTKDNNTTTKNIYLIQDELGNLGYGESFKQIINSVNGYDYYAMCDQDDFWLPNKIERAVNHISEYPQDKLILYSAAYWICDEELNKRKQFDLCFDKDKVTLAKVFMEGLVSGFTVVFNNTLKQKAFSDLEEKIVSHDKWLSCIVIGTSGVFIYDDEPTACYRRHFNTASATDQSVAERIKWKWKHVLQGDFFDRTLKLIFDYKKHFGNEVIKEEDIKFLNIFTSGRKIKRFFYGKRLRKRLTDELAIRFLLLFKQVKA